MADADDIYEEDDDEELEEPGFFSRLFRGGRYRINLVNYYLLGGLATMGTAALLIQNRLQSVDALLNAEAKDTVASQITLYDAFTDITTIAMACFGAFIVYACVLALYFSSRITQPMESLVDCIDAYRQDNFKAFPDTESKDLLGPVADALTGLGQHLAAREASPDAAN